MSSWKKELSILQRSKARAQEKQDLREESRICNAIGELYFQNGDFNRAHHEHLTELALAEATNDRIGGAVAQRKIGECLCEMKKYKEALEHQKLHLSMARMAQCLTEEQRALNNIGRTHFIWSDDLVGAEKLERLSDAQKAYLDCLEVCDKLDSVVDDREVMDMRARAYLNIGLIYESREMNGQGLQFMKKALVIARELKDLQTVQKCYVSIGDIHISSANPASALQSYEEALKVARKAKDKLQEVTALESMGKAFLHLEDFCDAKQSFKTAYKMCLHLDARKSIAKSYLKVRNVVSLLDRIDQPCLEMSVKRELYDKLGDIFTGLNLPKFALKYYLKDFELASELSLERKTLSNVIASVAMTYEDLNDHLSAIVYFEKDLALWENAPQEEFTSYIAIARNKTKAGHSYREIMELYQKALSLARQINGRRVVSVCRHIAQLARSEGQLDQAAWAEGEIEEAVALDPSAEESSCSEGEEGEGEGWATARALKMEENLTSLLQVGHESSSEDEERQIPVRIGESSSHLRVATRRQKSKLYKRNEKGETLLHLAAIQGNYKVAEQLIKQGMRVNETDNFGWTPLHEACNWGHTDVIELLLDSGASVDHPGRTGSNALTPLHDACWNMHEEVVAVLLRRGADPMITNGNGQTSLAQVTEMLKLTKETLANSKDRRKQAEIAEKSDNARCLENIAALLMAKMPRTEVEQDLNNTTVSVDRDRRIAKMNDGASAFQSSSYSSTGLSMQQGHLVERVRDRSGKHILLDEDEIALSTPRAIDPCDASVLMPPSAALSCPPRAHAAVGGTGSSPSGPAPGLYSVPEAEDELEPGHDGWLVSDSGEQEPARKRKRENVRPPRPSLSQPSTVRRSNTGQPTHHNLRLPQTRHGSSRQRRSFEGDVQTYGVASSPVGSKRDVVVIDDDDRNTLESNYFEPSSNTAQPDSFQLGDFHQPGQQAAPPPSSSLRIRVTVRQKTFLVPCPLSVEPPVSVGWLAEQASQRYLAQCGERPTLVLTTRDGAELFPGDPIGQVLAHNEEVIGVVETCDPSPLNQYTLHCKQAGTTPHPIALRLLKSEGAMLVLDLSRSRLPVDSVWQLLKCTAQCWASIVALNLEGVQLEGKLFPLLSSSLPLFPKLKTLNLSCCGIKSEGLKSLFKPLLDTEESSSVCHCSLLEEVRLSYNVLSGSEPFIWDIVVKLSGLKSIHLEHCDLCLTSLLPTSRALQGVSEVQLGGNSVPHVPALLRVLHGMVAAGAEVVGLGSTSCTSRDTPVEADLQDASQVLPMAKVTSLDLSNCSLTDLHLAIIASWLVGCSRAVHVYNFSCNELSLQSVATITSLVQASAELSSLDISGNVRLGSVGCLKVLSSVLHGRSVQQLLVSSCGSNTEQNTTGSDHHHHHQQQQQLQLQQQQQQQLQQHEHNSSISELVAEFYKCSHKLDLLDISGSVLVEMQTEFVQHALRSVTRLLVM